MAERLTDQEMTDCKRVFGLFDRDGDGTVSTRELTTMMRALGYSPTDNEALDMMFEIDPEGFGQLDFPGFLSVMSKKLKEYEADESLRLAFQVFDKHNNGQVSVADFRYMMENLRVSISEQEIEDMIKDADTTRSGFIQYNEFITMLSAK